MYQMVPDVEDLFHLNSYTAEESFQIASNGWWLINPRLGEFFSYFITENHIFIISLIHCIGMVTLLLSVYRFAIGKWPNFDVHSLITLLLITLLFFTISPLPNWWLDTLNWCYPFALFFALLSATESFVTGKDISKVKFILMIFAASSACISNEILALSTPVLLFSLNLITLYTRKQLIKNKKYWIILLCSISSTICFLSSPCWEYRASLLGIKISPLEYVFNIAKIERYYQLPTFFFHLSRITCLFFGIFIILFIFSKNVRDYWKNKEVSIRFATLIFIAFAMLMLCIMIPGYAPHREYRAVQFTLICVNVFVLFHIWNCAKGKIIFFSLFFVSSVFCSKHIWKDFKIGIALHNIWEQLEQMAHTKSTDEGILLLTNSEWNNILKASRIHESKHHHNPAALLIKTDRLTDKSFTHTNAVWGFNNDFYTKETLYTLYKNGYISSTEAMKGSPDIVLNSSVAQKLGLKGIVILSDSNEN